MDSDFGDIEEALLCASRMEEMQKFVEESNRIEGISRSALTCEIDALTKFLNLPKITVEDVVEFVLVNQPGAKLRNQAGLNVYIAGSDATLPKGGPQIERRLKILLKGISNIKERGPKVNYTVFESHRDYESLHPFTDCNGRSGRAIWAWMMCKYDVSPGIELGFLHSWYYQSLSV